MATLSWSGFYNAIFITFAILYACSIKYWAHPAHRAIFPFLMQPTELFYFVNLSLRRLPLEFFLTYENNWLYYEMAKLNSKQRKNYAPTKKNSFVGLAPG